MQVIRGIVDPTEKAEMKLSSLQGRITRQVMRWWELIELTSQEQGLCVTLCIKVALVLLTKKQ
jgi:hypothetical protein